MDVINRRMTSQDTATRSRRPPTTMHRLRSSPLLSRLSRFQTLQTTSSPRRKKALPHPPVQLRTSVDVIPPTPAGFDADPTRPTCKTRLYVVLRRPSGSHSCRSRRPIVPAVGAKPSTAASTSGFRQLATAVRRYLAARRQNRKTTAPF